MCEIKEILGLAHPAILTMFSCDDLSSKTKHQSIKIKYSLNFQLKELFE